MGYAINPEMLKNLGLEKASQNPALPDRRHEALQPPEANELPSVEELEGDYREKPYIKPKER